MEIIEKTSENIDEEYSQYEIDVNGKNKISVGNSGEPEDNVLYRDLDFVFLIPTLMREAFEAGKNGEEFIIKKEVLNGD